MTKNIFLKDGFVANGIKHFVLGLCENVEIIKPTTLVKHVKAKIKYF
ncbi:MAG: hypothetical protein U9R42_14230 [Bacteroidota bacterium]|nr:hypothetical protein [Bacteroidota bacterium]